MKNIPYELIARYLAGECNDDEKQQIQEWSRQHPDIMDEFTRMWHEIPSEEFTPDVEQALQKVNSRIDAKKSSRPRRIFMFVSGAAVAAVALIFILMNTVGSQQTAIPDGLASQSLLALNTDATETIERELPDGSKIWLNRSSSLKYPEAFDGDSREVYLEGEAFFDIAPDKAKPFIIHANNTQTRVVGTSFAVRAVKDEDVVVTVSTGIIKFSAEEKSNNIELRQGEQGICNLKEQKLEKNINPDPNFLAWKTKILVFKETSLVEVAKVLENTYHTPVSVDNSISSLQITSTFEQRSLGEIVQIIGITLGVNIQTGESGIKMNRSKELGQTYQNL